MTISSGVGPREARSFVSRLADRLVVELAARGLVIDHAVVHGPPLEPASIDLVVQGEARSLSDLLGTHALVECSERRSKRARKRWFVAVELTIAAAAAPSVELRADDVVIETCRAGGAGGQHVNRTESAVRALHRPSGISVRVESSRSQHANKALALARLAEALVQRDTLERARSKHERRARALVVERGNPVAVWRGDRSGLVRT